MNAFRIGMFNNSSIQYQFYGIMSLAEDLINNSYAFSSHSISAPLDGSNAMENRQFGAMIPNNRDHLEMRRRQQQQRPQQLSRKQSQKRRRQAVVGMIFCRYCPNRMPAHAMEGKLD